jgi:hypothetical protein
MTFGIDYAWTHPSPGAIKAAGYDFACRYLSRDTAKNLTADEARALTAEGISVVANWEMAAQAALKGKAQGIADAKDALAQAEAAGMPDHRPIYFSVDFDASEAQQAAINDYFDGVASVLTLGRTGGYGGYWPLSRLFNAKKITWGWQTYAWSGGHWDGRAQLRQIQNGIKVAGVDCDRDQAMVTDFGQWQLAGAIPAPPTPPTPQKDFIVTNWNNCYQGHTSDRQTRTVQGLLLGWGYGVGSKDGKPDGSWGPVTTKSVKAFQKAHGLSQDGQVGPHTISVLVLGKDVS